MEGFVTGSKIKYYGAEQMLRDPLIPLQLSDRGSSARHHTGKKLFLLFICILFNLFVSRVHADCSRLITLSPSLTEILYEIDLGKNVVGVSDYDHFPAEVKNLPKIGPSLSPSLEAVLRLQPSVIFVLREHKDVAQRFQSLGLKVEVFDHRTVKGILESVHEIGEICKKNHKAAALMASLTNSIEDAKNESKSNNTPVLFVVGRDYSSKTLKDIYLSGKDGFYDELIGFAGGQNVISEDTIGLKGLSLEALIRLNPKVIIEIVPPEINLSEDELKRAWLEFQTVDAVKNNSIYFLRDDWSYTPGPRFPLLLKQLLAILKTFN